MYAKLVKAPKRRERRRHSEEFKREVVEACQVPGVSMAAVALANGLNANLVRRWRKGQSGEEGAAGGSEERAVTRPLRPTTLVPVTVAAPEVESVAEIKIEIRREHAVVQVSWPVAQADACAAWLREMLR